MIKQHKNFIYILFSLAFLVLTSSCVDEVLQTDEPGDPVEIGQDEYGLALHVSLESMSRSGETAAFEDDEDYIDPSKISLLFFYKENNTLIKQFKPGDLTFIPIRSTSDGTLKNWYVRIKKIDDDFAEKLMKNDFKVAILANWDPMPVLNEEAKNGMPGEHINKLHHLSNANDPYYKDGIESDKYKIYDFLLDKTNYPYGNLGLFTPWVKNYFEEQEDAKNFILYYWYPGFTYLPQKEIGLITSPNDLNRPYKDLRIIWDFTAAYLSKDANFHPGNYFHENYGITNDEEKTAEVKSTAWADRIYDQLYTWFKEGVRTSEEDTKKLGNLAPYTPDQEFYDNGCFEFVRSYENEEEPEEDAYGTADGSGRYYIVLPGKDDYKQNAIKFKMTSSGYINIHWLPLESNTELKLETRNVEISSYITNGDDNNGVAFHEASENSFDMKITGDAQYVTIYCSRGKAAIYGIEYVKDRYLYETARTGIYVSSLNPIPMYGIQEYQSLGNYWKKGTLFNLSNFNRISSTDSYDSKDVAMLRSVAKVELKIPQNFNAHHVYLRCQNRYSRNEPVDIITPTDQIWVDDVNGSHNKRCEWFNIRFHDTFYSKNSETDHYRNKLAWYYGTWSTDGKKVGDMEIYSDWLTETDDNGNQVPVEFPHIMNPLIDRSDFTEFIYTGTADGIYDRYVLYVPEKFTTDPNSVKLGINLEQESPKVMHVEFRRGEDPSGYYHEDPYDNIDDNNHYRIYFTDKGYNSGLVPDLSYKQDGKVSQTWENYYEQNEENMKNHWPIMRNHVYSITVADASHKIVVVKIDVLPWRDIDLNSYQW